MIRNTSPGIDLVGAKVGHNKPNKLKKKRVDETVGTELGESTSRPAAIDLAPNFRASFKGF